MPYIVAIVGDAGIHCLPCARRVYGDPDVDWTLDPHPTEPIDARMGIGPKDSEGNVLGVLFDTDEDAYCAICGTCLEPIEE